MAGQVKCQIVSIKRLVYGLDSGQSLGRKPAPAQTFVIHGPGLRRLTLAHNKGRQIGKQQRTHGCHAVRTDFHELVHHRETAQNGPIPDLYMTCQLRVIGKNGVVAHLAIVRQVHVSHQPVVVANPGHATVPGRANVEGTKFTHGIAVADHQFTGLASILLVLRDGAKGVELKDAVVATNRGVALQHAVRADGRAGTDPHMWADDRVGTHCHRAVELGAGVNQRGGMDGGHGSTFRRWPASRRSTQPRLQDRRRPSRGP